MIPALLYLAFCVCCVALPLAAAIYFLRWSDRRDREAQRNAITSHLGPDSGDDRLWPQLGDAQD